MSWQCANHESGANISLVTTLLITLLQLVICGSKSVITELDGTSVGKKKITTLQSSMLYLLAAPTYLCLVY